MFGFEHIWFIVVFGLLNLLFWGGLIALAIYAVTRLTRPKDSDSALSILNERFARGEIDQKEFEQRKSALTGR
jgi:putative membrane protein